MISFSCLRKVETSWKLVITQLTNNVVVTGGYFSVSLYLVYN